MNTVSRIFVGLLVTSTLVIFPTISSSNPDEKKIRANAARYGVDALRSYLRSSEIELPASTLPPDRAVETVDDLLGGYVELRNSFVTAERRTDEFTMVGAAATIGTGALALSSVITPIVPVTLGILTAVWHNTTDIGNESMNAAGSVAGKRFIASHWNEIRDRNGISTFDELKTRLSDDEVFRDSYLRTFSDLKGRAPDEETSEWIDHVLVEASLAMSSGELDMLQRENLENSDSELVNVAKELSAHTSTVAKNLEDTASALEGISGSVDNLWKASAETNRRLSNIEGDVSLISDLMFDSLPARRKLELLQGGRLDSQFSCSADADSCERARLKDDLISQYSAEIELEDKIRTASAFSRNLANASTVAANLDLDADVVTALQIGSTVAQATTAYLQSDHLGAAAAITGVFRRSSDPDAERFKILMGYLDARFDRIDQALERIEKNQATILESVNQLSVQLALSVEVLDAKLGRLESRVEDIGAGVKALVWQDFASCNSVRRASLKPRRPSSESLADPNTLRFASLDAVRALIAEQGFVVVPCLQSLQEKLPLTAASGPFEDPFDLRFAKALLVRKQIPEGVELEADEISKWRTVLENFEINIYNPSFAIWQATVSERRGWSSASSNYAALTVAVSSTDDWRLLMNSSSDLKFECTSEDPLFYRVGLMLCLDRARRPDLAAIEIMSRPSVHSTVLDAADWVLIASQLADLRNFDNSGWIDFEQQLEADPEILPSSGRAMVEDMIQVLDQSIAETAMLFGPMLAERLAESYIEKGNIVDTVSFDLLQRNAYLRANFVQLLLEKSALKSGFISDPRRPRPLRSIYAAALSAANVSGALQFEYLHSIFGANLTFRHSDELGVYLVINGPSSSLNARLPLVGAFSEGRLSMPPQYSQLIGKREQLVDRLFSYSLFEFIDEGEMLDVMTMYSSN